jgi:hypothetical protein
MKYTFVLLAVCLYLNTLAAQDRFSVLAGGIAGYQKVEAESFRNVYGNSKFSYGGLVGVGNGEVYLGCKYRIMNVEDRSTKINGVDFTGDWKERLIVAGFHYYPRVPFHVEAGYVWLAADESLTPPFATSLSAVNRTYQDHGIDILVGLSLGHDIRVNFDIEYLLMLKNGSLSDGGTLPNLGGIYYGAGICYLL